MGKELVEHSFWKSAEESEKEGFNFSRFLGSTFFSSIFAFRLPGWRLATDRNYGGGAGVFIFGGERR
jgi:hypothetical protein